MSTAIVLRCDLWWCGDAYEQPATSTPLHVLRSEAELHGWSHDSTGERDLCPRHRGEEFVDMTESDDAR